MKPFEFKYGGMTFGADADIGITDVEGLDMPDVRVLSVENPGDHGAFVYAKYLPERVVTISGDVVSTNARTFQARVDRLKRAFRPRPQEAPLSFRVPGSEVRFVNCRPSKLSVPIDFSYQLKLANWVGEFIAADPRIYGHAQLRQVYNVNDNIAITNAGNFTTWLTVTFNAPLTNPKLIDVASGNFLLLNSTLTATQQRVVDFQQRTVLNGAGDNEYQEYDQTSTWFDFSAGTRHLRFVADSGSGTAVVRWRNTWIGV